MKRLYFVLIIAFVFSPVLAGDEQTITITSSSTVKDLVLVKANLHGKPTELSCFTSVPSCSAPTAGDYSMLRAASVSDSVYNDCTNIVLYKSTGVGKEKVGVYCWDTSDDCYMFSCSPVQVETLPVPMQRILPTLPIPEANPPQSPQMQTSQYDLAEAYKVYAALLQGDWQGTQQKTVVISTTTKFWRACVNPVTEKESGLKAALEQYNSVNKDKWRLQGTFGFGRQFELISLDEIESMFREGVGRGWERFGKRYPDSAGFVELSAVGFNEDKSVAVVYIGYHCGGMCGSGGVKFMQKKDGHWVHMSERECFEWMS